MESKLLLVGNGWGLLSVCLLAVAYLSPPWVGSLPQLDLCVLSRSSGAYSRIIVGEATLCLPCSNGSTPEFNGAGGMGAGTLWQGTTMLGWIFCKEERELEADFCRHLRESLES